MIQDDFMKGRPKWLCVLFLCAAPLLSAQTAGELDRLLDTRELSRGDAAYFTLSSVLTSPPARPSEAAAAARERGWLPEGAGPGAPITLGDLSFLLMKSFGLEGGLLYRFFPGPRYAYREMTRRGFIEGRAYQDSTVSGERFLLILGNVLSAAGDPGLSEPEVPVLAEAAPVVAEAPPAGEPVIVFEETESNIVIDDSQARRVVRLLNAVYFEADTAVLIETSRPVLDELGALLRSRPEATVTMRAYTAPYGTREERLEVSGNRADFCRDYLRRVYAVASDRMRVELYGADQLPEWGRAPGGVFVSVESFRCVEFILHE
jgi:outer membrane protein OmpA-like peptidoglycan-associated protein